MQQGAQAFPTDGTSVSRRWAAWMRETDILVVGGGMAGSTVAAMLGRAGIATILVDPHARYPADFRCEKMDDSQIALLRRTGLAANILPAMTASPDLAVYGSCLEDGPMTPDEAQVQRLAQCGRLFRIVDTMYWTSLSMVPRPPDLLFKPIAELATYSLRMAKALSEAGWTTHRSESLICHRGQDV